MDGIFLKALLNPYHKVNRYNNSTASIHTPSQITSSFALKLTYTCTMAAVPQLGRAHGRQTHSTAKSGRRGLNLRARRPVKGQATSH